jgi:predicted nucleic acid-binding protein
MLLDAGPAGRWSTACIRGASLSAPSLVFFEAANIIRRHESASLISQDQASQAHSDLRELPIDLWPYELLAERCWQLRNNLTVYDASYAALAELLGAPLVTLDRKIAGAPSLMCAVMTPEE